MMLCVLVVLLALTGILFLSQGGRVPGLVPGTLVEVSSSSIPVSWEVVGSPSLSAEFINRVLRVAGSPAAGKGQALYDLGVKYGIDPVYALAFFLHESSFGRAGWAVVNHSLGNIRCSAGYVCQGGYRSYASWEAGFEDWYRLIAGPVYVGRGLRTVEQIIPVYAPAADHNDEQAYINAVEQSVTAWRSGQVLV